MKITVDLSKSLEKEDETQEDKINSYSNNENRQNVIYFPQERVQ